MTRPACGTYAGYQAHGYRGEYACAECREANRRWNRSYRLRRLITKSTLVPVDTLRRIRERTTDEWTASEVDKFIRHYEANQDSKPADSEATP